ncbi:hypothetical protein [Komarekiella delphini-convector]|uniref:hypothetical protein n=1 Tax=Komarekiella delphini-convector TaxID=3050158 RepID=UPI0017815AD7|nr:hypothetical protein [Komarekiella delphini-convector]
MHETCRSRQISSLQRNCMRVRSHLEKKPPGTPEVMVPDLVSTCDYSLSLAISRW